MKRTIISTTQIKDYLTFSRSEQRGIFVLLTLMTLFVAASQIIPRFYRNRDYDISSSEKEILAFEELLQQADSEAAATKQKNFRNFRQNSFYPSRFDTTARKFKEESFVIELNIADTFELQRLRGIGSGFAKRIVKYREKLGGYVRVDQVKEVFGMDEERYNGIKEHLVVNKDSVHPVDLNKVTFKGLMSHPYFPFELTKSIMIYRKDHKTIKSIDELRNIPGISDSVFAKIGPYVKVE